MKLGLIIKSTAKKAWTFTRNHSPEILMVTGIALGITAAVVAVKQSRKVDRIVDELEYDIQDITDTVQIDGKEYTEEEKSHDILALKAKMGVKIARTYAPAVIIGTAAIACVICSNQIMRKRVAVLATAYAALDTSFREYRQRVVQEYGQDIDNRLFYGIEETDVKKVSVSENGETGETIETSKEEVLTGTESELKLVFDETNPHWYGDAYYTRTLLESTFVSIRNTCELDGHIFLNDVKRQLGFDEYVDERGLTKTGQLLGWKKGDEIEPHLVPLRDTVSGKTVGYAIDLSSAHYILDCLG